MLFSWNLYHLSVHSSRCLRYFGSEISKVKDEEEWKNKTRVFSSSHRFLHKDQWKKIISRDCKQFYLLKNLKSICLTLLMDKYQPRRPCGLSFGCTHIPFINHTPSKFINNNKFLKKINNLVISSHSENLIQPLFRPEWPIVLFRKSPFSISRNLQSG